MNRRLATAVAFLFILSAMAVPASEPMAVRFSAVELPVESPRGAYKGIAFSHDCQQMAAQYSSWRGLFRRDDFVDVAVWTLDADHAKVELCPLGKLDPRWAMLICDSGLVFSQDGAEILTMLPRPSDDGKHVILVDARTMRTRQMFDFDPELRGESYRLGRITGFAFSPDLSKFAVVTSKADVDARGYYDHNFGEVWIWDMESGNVLAHHQWESGGFLDVTFSRDGGRLAVGGIDYYSDTRLAAHRGKACVINCETGQVEITVHPRDMWVGSVAFSVDQSQLLIGGSPDAMRAFRVDTGELARTLARQGRGGTGEIGFSADGSLVAFARSVGGDPSVGAVHILTSSEYQEIAVLEPKPWQAKRINAMAFSPDGSLFALATSSDVCLWRIVADDTKKM
jgi:WD40 repeat protein